ncbi:MAG: alcohol dehydrogenase [Dehalococcoidales bacterium]|jgi:alcohol dehydrogenase class IV|nr:alcohol dehydrogenase [Dehalococcoidales bacterium]MDP6449163.1 iron-containing alcohol dehydrogenase [Dehalococcoidales bacterium]MDP6577018.1 iron-containing alcohol dehydrogenase [Dehalococcoidales bacterium]|tara:strand:+ start:516 stop:1685 length:1170 start_codon:yes stop_codon:yes gene_type:complete
MSLARTFHLPQVLITGLGASAQVGEEIGKLKGHKGLMVTDQVLVKLGALDGIKQALQKSGVAFAIFDSIFTEPAVDFVAEGLKAYRENRCDFLLAFGGGSAIDTAKAIAVMVTNSGSITDYQGMGKIPQKGASLIAVPTTAGTGSEVSLMAIITDTKRDVKMLIGSPFLTPDVAIVDPLLTLSMPRSLTAATGMDALTHAIEAYVSVKAQPMSDIFCLSAIEHIAGNLKQAWTEGSNIEAREKTMLGALQAGIAFSNSSVALVHGMARPIGAYFHVSHGASNAALLGVVTEFSLSGNLARYARIAQAMGVDVSGRDDMEAARQGMVAVQKLIKDIKVSSLRELGVDGEKLVELAPRMAEDALASGSPANNPRPVTKEEIIELYKLAHDQ